VAGVVEPLLGLGCRVGGVERCAFVVRVGVAMPPPVPDRPCWPVRGVVFLVGGEQLAGAVVELQPVHDRSAAGGHGESLAARADADARTGDEAEYGGADRPVEVVPGGQVGDGA
jgi:hypothetical protein